MALVTGTQVSVAQLNGTSIAYEVAGTGPPLVLLHAGIADRRMWDQQFAVFAKHFKVIRYDMRGYGQSPMPPGCFAHQRDLYALLTLLEIERAFLLGSSLGGAVAIDFALEYPHMAAALITVCSAPSGYHFVGEPPPQLEAIHAALQAGDLIRAAELEVQIWVDGRLRTPDQVDPRLRDRVREMNMIALASQVANLGAPEQREPPAATRLHEIATPTLVIVAALDEPNILAAGEQMAAQIPGAKHAVIEGAAHFPNMERPAELNAVVLEFLAALAV